MIRTVSDDRTRVSKRARAQSGARTCRSQANRTRSELIASAHMNYSRLRQLTASVQHTIDQIGPQLQVSSRTAGEQEAARRETEFAYWAA